MRLVSLLFVFIMSATLSLSAENVELGTLLSETGARLEWNSLLGTGVISRGENRVIFTLNAPWIIVNSGLKIATAGIRRDQASIVVPGETAAGGQCAASQLPRRGDRARSRPRRQGLGRQLRVFRQWEKRADFRKRHRPPAGGNAFGDAQKTLP
jgi:hypothetical protein